jgi:hypothetical protein
MAAMSSASESDNSARRRLDALAVARLLSVYLPVVGTSVARRAWYGPRQPSWPLTLELFVDVIRHGSKYAHSTWPPTHPQTHRSDLLTH